MPAQLPTAGYEPAGHTLLMSLVSLPVSIFLNLFFLLFLLTFVVFLLTFYSYAKEFIYTERLFLHSLPLFQLCTVGYRSFLRTLAGNASNEIFSASWHHSVQRPLMILHSLFQLVCCFFQLLLSSVKFEFSLA